MTIEIVTLSVYMILLFSLGIVFSKFNRNLSDYVRGGAQATWWMIGASNTIIVVSAFTFTGAASLAFRVGPTSFVSYLANIVGFIIAYFVLAAWFRQTRAFTVPDIVKARFGVPAEQLMVYFGVFLGPIAASIQLWALSVFAVSLFQTPMIPTIMVIGSVVIFYSTAGGRWAVMATDFIQNLLIFGITLLVAVLAFIDIGGFTGFFSHFSRPEIAQDFQWFHETGEFEGNEFTFKWFALAFFMTLYYQLGFASSGRYLAAKTGEEAKKSSILSAVLSLIGAIVWMVPPMIARMKYEAEVLALAVDKPAEASYTFIAQKMLPNGLMGIMFAAMFAATMSSMDTGLNNQTGAIVRNVLPRIFEKLKRPVMTPKAEVFICKIVTLMLGVLIVTYSSLFAMNKEIELFQAYYIIASVIGIPLGFPLLAGLWVKRLNGKAYFIIMGACLLPSIYTYADTAIYGTEWTYFDRALWVFVFGIIATFLCVPFFKYTPEEKRKRIDEFFATMKRPVDSASEIGESRDYQQLFMIGNIVLISGGLILLLVLVPNPLWGRLCVLALAGFFFGVGMLMRWGAKKEKQREKALLEGKA